MGGGEGIGQWRRVVGGLDLVDRLEAGNGGSGGDGMTMLGWEWSVRWQGQVG